MKCAKSDRDCDKCELSKDCEVKRSIDSAPDCDSCDDRRGEPVPWGDLD